MKKQLVEALAKDFPIFYRDMYGNMLETCMAFGIETGDGWEPLIREASAKLEAIAAKELLPISPAYDNRLKATQVKEKFGELRLYTNYSSNEVDLIISEAEDKSIKTCESCGKPGELRNHRGWYTTLCNDDFEDYKKKRT